MHHRKSTLICSLLFFLLLTASFAQAQPPAVIWEAWLYEPDYNELIRVDSNGVPLDQQALPVMGDFALPDNVAVSPNGRYVAYVLEDALDFSNLQFMVYDTQRRVPIVSYPIPAPTGSNVFDSLTFSSDSHIFNAANTQVAFGYQVDSTWTLVNFDLATGNVVSTLDYLHPDAQPYGFDWNTPVPRYHTGDVVHVMFIRTQTEGAPEYPAFEWDVVRSRLFPNDLFRVAGSEVFAPTGEVIMSVPDEAFPNQNDMMMMFPHLNTLHVGTLDTFSTTPVYHSLDFNLFSPTFVMNGALVLVRAQNIEAGGVQWRYINRDGVVVGTLGIGDVWPHNIIGTADGLVYSADAADMAPYLSIPMPNTEASLLMYADTRSDTAGNPGVQIYRSQRGHYPELVWVGDNLQSSRPIVSGGWPDLSGTVIVPPTPIVIAPPPVISPTPIVIAPPVTSPTLTVGGRATINTTEGDNVNVRSGPGTSFAVLTQFSNGTAVTLLEGPTAGNGFTWWRVQRDDGQVGWVVESADGVRVLIPGSGAGVAPTPAPIFDPGMIQVGGYVRITETGDNLNARTGPGTGNPVMAILQAGQVLRVVGGPQQNNGFRWWQLETSEGRAWAADGNGTESWLVPSRAP